MIVYTFFDQVDTKRESQASCMFALSSSCLESPVNVTRLLFKSCLEYTLSTLKKNIFLFERWTFPDLCQNEKMTCYPPNEQTNNFTIGLLISFLQLTQPDVCSRRLFILFTTLLWENSIIKQNHNIANFTAINLEQDGNSTTESGCRH